jgi:hypothetical protein
MTSSHEEWKVQDRSRRVDQLRGWIDDFRKPEEKGSKDGPRGAIYRALEKADITLEEVGTTHEELEQITRRRNLEDAQYELEAARNAQSERQIADALVIMREALSRAGASLEDIGTSDAEMTTLSTRHPRKPNARDPFLD